MTRFIVDLIRWPSRGEVLSDFWTRAAGVVGILDSTLAGCCGADRGDAGAKRLPAAVWPGIFGSAAAKLFTASLWLAFWAASGRLWI